MYLLTTKGIDIVSGQIIKSPEELNISILGDSMTWIGGENCDNTDGWTYYFKKEIHPESIKIYARSGATLSNTPNTVKDSESYSEILNDNNVVYNQAMRFKEDLLRGQNVMPDLLIIYAGANDAWFKKQRASAFHRSSLPLSSIRSTDLPGQRLTLEESIALVVSNIREIAPQTSILLVTPVEMSKTSPENIAIVSDIIENTGKALDCDVLRADKKSGISHKEEQKLFTNTRDGVHTNAKGAKLIGTLIANKVRSLMVDEIIR